mgnify:CR=1 FL=1
MSAPPEAALPQKPGHRLAPLSVLLGVTLSIGIFLSARSSLTTDEAFTLHTTGRTLRYAWDEARSFEMQPPLYFVLLTLWQPTLTLSSTDMRSNSATFWKVRPMPMRGMSWRGRFRIDTPSNRMSPPLGV